MHSCFIACQSKGTFWRSDIFPFDSSVVELSNTSLVSDTRKEFNMANDDSGNQEAAPEDFTCPADDNAEKTQDEECHDTKSVSIKEVK